MRLAIITGGMTLVLLLLIAGAPAWTAAEDDKLGGASANQEQQAESEDNNETTLAAEESEEESEEAAEKERAHYLWGQMLAEEDRTVECVFYTHRENWDRDDPYVASTDGASAKIFVDPYVVQDDYNDTFYLRLRIGYRRTDWVFMDQIWFVVDGQREYVEFESWDVHSETGWRGATAWRWGFPVVLETVDLIVERDMISAIGNADEVMLVISGAQARTALEFNESRIEMFREVMDFYDFLVAGVYQQDGEEDEEENEENTSPA